jgi:hypothetical protein
MVYTLRRGLDYGHSALYGWWLGIIRVVQEGGLAWGMMRLSGWTILRLCMYGRCLIRSGMFIIEEHPTGLRCLPSFQPALTAK